MVERKKRYNKEIYEETCKDINTYPPHKATKVQYALEPMAVSVVRVSAQGAGRFLLDAGSSVIIFEALPFQNIADRDGSPALRCRSGDILYALMCGYEVPLVACDVFLL